jgi:hypothetical protein
MRYNSLLVVPGVIFHRTNLRHVPPPPPPASMRELVQVYVFTQCVRGGEGGDRVVWRAYTGAIHCVFDQIRNLQNCFTTPKQKPRRGGGLRQLNTCRQVPLQVYFKKSQHLGLESISYFVHGQHGHSDVFTRT